MKNVRLGNSPVILLLLTLLVNPAAEAKFAFFSRQFTNIPAPSLVGASSNVASPEIGTNLTMTSTMMGAVSAAVNQTELPGAVGFDTLAATSGQTASGRSPAATTALGESLAKMGVRATSAEAVARFANGADLAMGVAQALLATPAATSGSLSREDKFAMQLPPGLWPNDSKFATPSQDIVARAERALLASNTNAPAAVLKPADWGQLDRDALHFAHALQFVGHGMLRNEDPLFLRWSIANAVETSNILNNTVIDELQIFATHPKSPARDAKIHALLVYVKNPILRAINGWLAELAEAVR